MSRGDQFDAESVFPGTRDAETKKKADVSKYLLPSIMYSFYESYMSMTLEAYVEYMIVATHVKITATVLLYIRRPSTEQPITTYNLGARIAYQEVKTQKLLPEFADSPLTMGQKLKKTLRPSKVPRYTFRVRVIFPTILQLEHPEPLPLKVYILPFSNPERTTICPDGDMQDLPSIRLIDLNLKIESNYGTY